MLFKKKKIGRFWRKGEKHVIENCMLSMDVGELEAHKELFLKACNKYKRIGIDTETTGLSWVTDRLLMVQFATGPLDNPGKWRWVIAVNSYNSTILPQDAADAVQEVLDTPKIVAFLHNAKFDMHFLTNIGVDFSRVETHDTCVMGFMIDTTKANKLKIRVKEEFGEDMVEFTDKFKLGGVRKMTLEDYTIEQVGTYAALDPEKTLQLANKFFSVTKGEKYIHSGSLVAEDAEVSLLYDRIEAKMTKILFNMERRGIRVDKRKMVQKSIELGQEIGFIEKQIYTEAGSPFNLNSWQQLQKVYLSRGEKLKSTNETVLQELANHGDNLAALILQYREKKKIKSVYLDGMGSLTDEKDRIHTSLNLHIAGTGRLSSSNPNLQNIKKDRWMRELFIPAKGKLLIVKDYGQLELRVLAVVSEDPVMMDEFLRGVDIHRVNAGIMYNKDPKDITKEERQSAKAGLSFGCIYGMSPMALAQIIKVPESKAEYMINFIFHKYAGVDLYMKRMQMSSTRTGYVKTFLGRRRQLPNVRSDDRKQFSYAMRQIKNTPIQGGAGDLVKAAMIHCDENKRLRDMRCAMLLQVHDELIFEVPEEHAEEANELTTQLMQNVPIMKRMPIPFTVEGGVGKNWYEAKGE